MQILKETIRRQIIEAATEVFYLKGYDKTSMNKIAEKASISTSNIYNYYGSKKVLFEAIVNPVYDNMSYFFNSIVQYEKKENLKPTDLIQLLTREINGLMADYHKEIVLLLRYTDNQGRCYKSIFAQILEKHFLDSLKEQQRTNDLEMAFQVIAHNFVDGFIQIAEYYNDEENPTGAIKYFLTYHLAGMTPLIVQNMSIT